MWKRWRKTPSANDIAVETEQPAHGVRSAERRVLYREATLHLPMAVKISAVAMDISPLGARLRLSSKSRLPDDLFVTILDEVKKVRAKVAWQDGVDVGLEFIDPDLGVHADLEY